MDWTLIIAAVFAGWVALSLIGYERQRQLNDAAVAEAPEAAAEPDGLLTLPPADAAPARRAA